ncbi:DMT family transporter [Salidesulfovibrio brasiliensis]|uniref:DMT family transporter n=1 Tax=Salidesulfovibrio brasiliensis TaxID=221711 RepID=UPI0006D1A116|nr:DMT family transporter [Salidesulfovibrio brasiliensis]
MNKAPIHAYLALLGGVTLWASSFVALKYGFRAYDPMVIIFGRMLVASLCFLLVIRNFRNVQYRAGDWKPLLFMGVCEPGLYFVFESLALTYTDASQAGMICAMVPILVAIPAAIFLQERISRRTLIGFALAIFGAVVLSLDAEASESAPNPMLGNFLEFVAMCCATGYMITLKRLSPRYGPWFLTMIQAFIGCVFFFPLLFLPTTELPTAFDPVGVASILYLGVFVTLAAYGLYNVGMSQVPANQASAFVNLIPVITLFLSWMFLGERLTVIQYAASALVLTGVWVSQDKQKDKKADIVPGTG